MIKNLVSVPRSGQHLIERSLNEYHRIMNLPYSYCEFYSQPCGCKHRPCMSNINSFQKNHDWEVTNGIEYGIKIKSGEKYLFLYRNCILKQLDAAFRLYCCEKKITKSSNQIIDYNNNYIRNLFRKYVNTYSKYYKNIYKKWLTDKVDNILCIEYTVLILNYEIMFKKILNFFEIPVNEEVVKKVEQLVKPKFDEKISIKDKYFSELKYEVINILNSNKIKKNSYSMIFT